MTDVFKIENSRLTVSEKPAQENNPRLDIQNQFSSETIATIVIVITFVGVCLYCFINKDKIAFEAAMDVQGSDVYKRKARAIVEHIFKVHVHTKVENSLNDAGISAQTVQFNNKSNDNCVITIDINILKLNANQLDLKQMQSAVEILGQRLKVLDQIETVEFLRTNSGIFNLVGVIENPQGFEVKRYIICLNTLQLQQALIEASKLYAQKPPIAQNLLESSINEPFNPGNWGQ